jgi:uncharacterized membrane protein
MDPSGMYTLAVFVRFLHVLSGIFWIGLLYFFNVVNVPTMKALDAATKGKVVPVLLPKARRGSATPRSRRWCSA